MKNGLLVALMLVSVLSFSQRKNLKITNLQPQSENFIFPKITFPEKPSVENKINTFLQVDELEFVPKSGKNPYQLASTATNSYQNYLYFYGWKKLDSPKNILSLEMEGEASGAYSEGFTNYRNFDLRTGNFINLKDLFQPNSFNLISEMINSRVRKRVADYVIELKSAKEKEQDSEEQIEMYEDCFTEYTLDYLEFHLEKNDFTIFAGRCSNHAMRALDDLGNHEIVFKYKEIEKYFSPFAKNLLSNSDKALSQNNIQNKLFKGTIDGRYPIFVLVKDIYEDGSLSIVYWYEKNKKLIEWSGSFSDNHLSATENDFYNEENSEWIPRAKIEADLKGKKIIGTWQDYKTKKYLKLELEEL